MRKFLLALLLVPMAFGATATVTFNYNFTGIPACSTSVTINCWDHFEAGTLAGSTLTTLVNIPLPSNPTGTVNGITGSFTDSIVFGSQVLAVQMVAKNASGGRVTSDPTLAQAPVNVDVPAATGFSAVVK